MNIQVYHSIRPYQFRGLWKRRFWPSIGDEYAKDEFILVAKIVPISYNKVPAVNQHTNDLAEALACLLIQSFCKTAKYLLINFFALTLIIAFVLSRIAQ